MTNVSSWATRSRKPCARCQNKRLAAGAERAWLPLVSFEDERLLAQSPGVELRALQQALQEPIGAATQARVISLDRYQPTGEWPEAVSWSSALEWLLQA